MENTKKSLKTRPQRSLLPSVQDVAQASSMKTETESSETGEVLKCTLILLKALSQEMISSDVWYLAGSFAQEEAKDAGIQNTDKIFSQIFATIAKSRDKSFTGHMIRAGFMS